MQNKPLSRALWACVDAETILQETSSLLTDLHAQLPDALNSPVVDLLDRLHAATHSVQAARYNILIALRHEEK